MKPLPLLLLALAACSKSPEPGIDAPQSLQLSFPDFKGEIPVEFTKKPPRVVWSDPPAGTKELVLIVDDPDAHSAEPYVHYVLTRIAPKGPPPEPVVGKNEAGQEAFDPLDPTIGEFHRYRFRVYALDLSLGDAPKSKKEVLAAIKGHVLAWGELTGVYGRR